MGQALRDAYHQACLELESAYEALAAAQARVACARGHCEKLEAALRMTTLADGAFPQIATAPSCGAALPDIRK